MHSLNRLSHDFVNQGNLIDEFIDAEVEIIFSDHKIDDIPKSSLIINIQRSIWNLYIKTNLELSNRGKEHSAKEGHVSLITIAPLVDYKHVRHFDRNKDKI
ncbi:MAG: hypothetical protein ACR5KW_00465 [Wolbachia sp.]